MASNDFTFSPYQPPSSSSQPPSVEELRQSASPMGETASHAEAVAHGILGTKQTASAAIITPVASAQISALSLSTPPGQVGEPSCHQMVKEVSQTINTVPPDASADANGSTPTSTPRTAILVTGTPHINPIATAPSQLHSPENALLHAARRNDCAEFRNIIMALKKEGKEVGPVIQSVLKALAEKGELAEHCLAFREIVRLMPHLTNCEYKPVALTPKELGKTGTFQNALRDISDKDLDKARKALDFLSSNPRFYFEGLKRATSIYSSDEVKDLIANTARRLLAGVRTQQLTAEEDENEDLALHYRTLYCDILGSLSKLDPDIGILILEDNEGLIQTGIIDVAIERLQQDGILTEECSTDVYKKAIQAKGPAEAQSVAKKMLETVAKTGDTLLYGFALSELSRLYPDITFLVNPQGTLEPEGIRRIIKHLKDTGKMNSDFPCIVYGSLDGCEADLKKQLADPKITRISVIVRHEPSSHVTPILLERGEECWKALITDSTGHMTDRKTGKNWDQQVGTMLRDAVNGVKVYSTDYLRQNSPVGCPIFAILDVVQFAKTPNLLEDKEGKFIRTGCHYRDFIMKELPPAMMRSTQSLKKLVEYRKEDKSPERVALAKTVKKHTASLLTSNGPTKPYNCFSRHLFNTYSNLLVTSVIGTQAG